MTMSYYSTQIRDSLGREIRVSKEPALILQNAGLIFGSSRKSVERGLDF